MKYYLFVYGTLRKNECNHYYLKGVRCLSENCWTNGKLFDTGLGYPAMIEDLNKRVYGELYEISDEQIEDIDDLEGYVGDEQYNDYDRIVQNVYTDTNEIKAYIYVYTKDKVDEKLQIQFNDWKCRQYLKDEELLYFAYGSCMDDERLKVANVDSFFKIMGRGVLQNYMLAFTHKLSDGGRADILEKSGDFVEGVVYSINQKALQYLFRREGVFNGSYRPAFIDITLDGKLYTNVLTFIVLDKEKVEVAPPIHYAVEILRGAKGVVSHDYYERLKRCFKNKFKLETDYLL